MAAPCVREWRSFHSIMLGLSASVSVCTLPVSVRQDLMCILLSLLVLCVL